MKNTYALHHARRLYRRGVDYDTIRRYIVPLATYREQREILASLTSYPIAA